MVVHAKWGPKRLRWPKSVRIICNLHYSVWDAMRIGIFLLHCGNPLTHTWFSRQNIQALRCQRSLSNNFSQLAGIEKKRQFNHLENLFVYTKRGFLSAFFQWIESNSQRVGENVSKFPTLPIFSYHGRVVKRKRIRYHFWEMLPSPVAPGPNEIEQIIF